MKIKAGIVVTANERGEVLRDVEILIEDDRIIEIGERVPSDDVRIDAKNKIVMPGFFNAHTHLSMTLFRGIAEDMPLMKWLQEKIWPLEAKLTGWDCYVGALLGCLEMIKSGTVGFADMYFFMEDVARAVEESGLKASLSYGMIELGDPERGRKEIEKGRKFIKEWHGKANGRIRCAYGPHAPYTCSKDFLQKVRDLAEEDDVDIHIHVSETRGEFEQIKKETGKTPVQYLDEIGFLSERVLAAHCVWLDEKDLEVLARRGVRVAHNPVSNMKLGSGIAPVVDMIQRGILVALGTDGAASNNNLDMFEEMKVCSLLQRVSRLDPSSPRVDDVLAMATRNAAKAVGFPDSGVIEEGKKADMIIVNPKKPHMTPLHDPKAHLVYSARGCDVETVIVDGRVIMEDRRLLTMDEDKVIEMASEVAADLLTRD